LQRNLRFLLKGRWSTSVKCHGRKPTGHGRKG